MTPMVSAVRLLPFPRPGKRREGSACATPPGRADQFPDRYSRSRMTRRLAFLVALAMASSACSGVVDAVSPGYFYGYVASLDAQRICVGDAREEEPDKQRCFLLAAGIVPAGVGEATLVKIAFDRVEAGEEDDTATRIDLLDD